MIITVIWKNVSKRLYLVNHVTASSTVKVVEACHAPPTQVT